MEFDEIYASFQPKIYRYVARLVGSQDAEDLTQEVFVKVHKALDAFRNEAHLSTWIYRIATNAAIDRMRKPSFQRESIKHNVVANLIRVNATENAAEDANPSVEKISVEEQVIHKEMNKCIRGVIENLPEKYRMVVILSELEGLPNKAIAEILEVSLDVVKVRLHRGKAKLKQELLHCCKISWDERNELTCETR